MPEFIEFRPGLRLSVMQGRGVLSASYQGVIRQVSEDGIRIDWPHRNRDAMELNRGDDVTVVVQMHGRMYTCSTRVLDLQEVPTETVLIAEPSEVRHNERRQFYRLLTNITPRYAAQTNEDGDEVLRLEARILDLSGGGVQLRTEEWIPVGARIRLVFMLDQDPLQLDITVMALAVREPDTGRTFHRVNAKFVEIDRDTQERIIRFIFRQQMLLRQQGVV